MSMTHQMLFSLPCSLGNNHLGEVGGTAVAKALETNTGLQNLK